MPVFNPSTQEAKKGDLFEFEASLIHIAPGHPGLHKIMVWRDSCSSKGHEFKGLHRHHAQGWYTDIHAG